MDAKDAPVVITQNEYTRRMKDMAQMSGDAMSRFYAEMPDNFTITVNGNHPLVIDILGDVEKEYGDGLKKVNEDIDAARKEEKTLDDVLKNKKEEELSTEEKDKRTELIKKVSDLMAQRDTRLREIGAGNQIVKQLIDLALLSTGMLKGESLDNFIRRSVELIGK